ncbi:PAS and ANTAR domain-containing protein [Phycicoccus sp. CSK15P-2]|uniref:PAS and ANTAR domain-containing protein n=1 Tax=Phycicoccus sp. CSK15P-2 TaxID=2807627 RepID=UPI001950EB33|nr:PAS and ANTAR domain-containing protein [Phycicoccus sp. CSK15P-2]MBM6403668.1 PAS and ANTAR domain-containing protein [Phycicoccus sp. CSK15P-2]
MTTDGPPIGEPAGQDSAPVPAEGTYDFATRTWSWSPEMYELLGLRDDGRDPSELVYERMFPSDRPTVEGVLARAIEDAGPFAGQYRLRGDDGRERSIAFVGDVERTADGRPALLRGLAFDVSASARLASSEAVAAATADRAAIEQVKGALMFTYGLDADAAFGLLSRYSQRANVKVSTVARRVAELLAAQDEPGTEHALLRTLDQALHGEGGVADAG